MTLTSGKRLSAQDRKAQLILLGLEHLRTNPGEISSLDRIAEAAGISRSLLFHYFPTKRDFTVEVVRAAADLLLAVTDPPADMDALGKLHHSLEAFVGFVDDHNAVYTSLLRGSAGTDERILEIIDDVRATMADRVIEGLGVERTPTLRTTLRGWVGFVEEATIDYLRHHDIERADLIALFERILVSSVLS